VIHRHENKYRKTIEIQTHARSLSNEISAKIQILSTCHRLHCSGECFLFLLMHIALVIFVIRIYDLQKNVGTQYPKNL
jgi:hypothetical protein